MSDVWKRLPPGLREIGLLLVLCLGAFVVYGRSLHVPFQFDDLHVIVTNVGVQRLDRLPLHWTDAVWASSEPGNRQYRPLCMSVLTLAWWAGAGSVVPFHVVKIVLHALLAWLVFLISRRLLQDWGAAADRYALLAAVLWLVHPALSESTIYVSAISSTLCALFYATGFYCYLRWAQKDASWLWLVAGLVAYAAAMLSKEEGVTLPLVCGLHAVLLGRHAVGERPKLLLGAALATVQAVALVVLIAHMLPAENAQARGPVPPVQYFATQLRGIWWYGKIWLLPTDLNPDNTQFGFSTSLGDEAVVLAALGHLAVLIACALSWRRFPLAVFTVLAFYVTLSPTSSFIVLAEPVNERRMVIAYLFLAAPTVVAIASVLGRLSPASARIVGPLLAVTAAVASIAFVQSRIGVWATQDALWEEVVRKNPNNWRAYNNLAVARFKAGRFDEARALAAACLRAWPRYPPCLVNLGAAQEQLGHFEEADAAFRGAVQAAPTSPDAYFSYARFLAGRGRFEEAFRGFAEADRLAGGNLYRAKVGMLQLAAGPLGWPPEKVAELQRQVSALSPP